MSGQSNAEYFYQNSQSEFETYINGASNKSTWGLFNGATSGSSAIYDNYVDTGNTLGWWRDDNTGDMGDCWPKWTGAVDDAVADDRIVSGTIWNQGEADAGFIGRGDAPRYKANLIAIFEAMRDYVPGLRIFIMPMNRRGTASGVAAVNITGYVVLRQMHIDLAGEYDWITLLPEIYDQVSDGGPHSTNSGYDAMVPRLARKIAKTFGENIEGGVDGPRLIAASREGTAAIFTFEHDGGSGLTPSADGAGLYWFDDGAAVALSSVSVVDGTHIEATLASEPADGSVELAAFGYGIMADIDPVNVVRDNQPVPLPVRSGEVAPEIIVPTPAYGPDLITDPGLNNPAQWAVSSATYAQVAGGVLHMSRNGNFFAAATVVPFPETANYRVRFTVKNYAGGQFQLKQANSTASGDLTGAATLLGDLFNANDTYETVVAGTAGKLLTFKPGGSAALWEWDLDDIQINKVL